MRVQPQYSRERPAVQPLSILFRTCSNLQVSSAFHAYWGGGFGNIRVWEVTDGQFAGIEVDGLEAVIQYGEDDKPLPDQLARRMLPALGRAVRTMSVEQLVVLRRNFRSSPVVPKSRSVYSPKFLDLKEKISFLGPSYDSGPKLSQKNPAIKSFMPGDTGLCVVDSKALTSEQVKVAQSGFFCPPPRFPFRSE